MSCGLTSTVPAALATRGKQAGLEKPGLHARAGLNLRTDVCNIETRILQRGELLLEEEFHTGVSVCTSVG